MNKEPFNLEKFKAGQLAETRGGRVAHFVAFVPESEECSQLVFRVGEMMWLADASGRTSSGLDAPFDTIYMAPPYHDFEIDEPVVVRRYGETWCKRHFAGVDDQGKPMTFADGTTSWSAGPKVYWDEARRPTPEELEGGE